MGKRLEWTLHEGRCTNGQKKHEKVFIGIREIQVKTIMRSDKQ